MNQYSEQEYLGALPVQVANKILYQNFPVSTVVFHPTQDILEPNWVYDNSRVFITNQIYQVLENNVPIHFDYASSLSYKNALEQTGWSNVTILWTAGSIPSLFPRNFYRNKTTIDNQRIFQGTWVGPNNTPVNPDYVVVRYISPVRTFNTQFASLNGPPAQFGLGCGETCGCAKKAAEVNGLVGATTTVTSTTAPQSDYVTPVVVGLVSLLAGVGIAYLVTKPPKTAQQIAREMKRNPMYRHRRSY